MVEPYDVYAPDEKGRRPFFVRMTVETKKEWARIAEERGMSLDDLIQEAMTAYLQK